MSYSRSPESDPALRRDARIVYVVDDDELVRGALAGLLRSIDLEVRAYGSIEEFVAAPRHGGPACLVLDVRLKGQSGLAFQRTLMDDGGPHMPIIFMSAYGDIPMTVKAMKAGAMDFLAKPFRDQDMIDAVISALERDAARLATDRQLGETRACWESLTPREREVLRHVADGLMNKQIAASMGIAEITAKIHRGQAMRKMNSRSVAELVRKMEALGIERLAPR
ncbi:response regulator transcription factor [Burkholderia gladioli]|uniref:response regulator transcription factor n=1 Tax=Burkholderia gladioli TaxID=28095 RepID=UPI000BBD3B97|nr:response regulator [Burkholderia gladioli]ATF88116.1 DNA-binding response regulator [Burkholderia gladioli pv. gladioli]MBJ9712769.1 response regulator transcription factor [Burkholderia gladioli]MBU9154455.1 response regulator [Burkholderia gladioli]MCH7268935.1 response regulator [Burkholderia gladioli]MDR8086411.1 response regulator [Burkholderia gladioli]